MDQKRLGPNYRVGRLGDPIREEGFYNILDQILNDWKGLQKTIAQNGSAGRDERAAFVRIGGLINKEIITKEISPREFEERCKALGFLEADLESLLDIIAEVRQEN